MRNVAPLIEPILLHLAADKVKERHDALVRLKAILDADSSAFDISSEVACRVVQVFLKMLRLELKGFLPSGESARDCTQVMLNKIQQLMRDYKWLISLFESAKDSSNLLASISDIVDLSLDILESPALAFIYSEVLFVLKSCVLNKKPYLCELGQEQWDRFIEAINSLVFPIGDRANMSSAMESDISCCIFFLSLHIPGEIADFPLRMYGLMDLLAELILFSHQKSQETPALALLFRCLNYLMHKIKSIGSVNYTALKDKFTNLLLLFQSFKTPVVHQEFLLFFLENEVQTCDPLRAIALHEISKPRLRPNDIDPLQLGESIRAYLDRDPDFVFPKGHLAYVISLNSCAQYIDSSEFNIESFISNKQRFDEMIPAYLFQAHLDGAADIEYLCKLLESTSSARQAWIAAVIIACTYLGKIEDSRLKSLFNFCMDMIFKRSSVSLFASVLTAILKVAPSLAHQGPAFAFVLETCANFCSNAFLVEFLRLYYLAKFEGLWGFKDALEAYSMICEGIVSFLENLSDPRLVCEYWSSNCYQLSELLGFPFLLIDGSQSASKTHELIENDIMVLLPSSSFPRKPCRLIPVALSAFDEYSMVLVDFKRRLISCFESIGFITCKAFLQNRYQANVKETNFASSMVQMMDLHLSVSTDLHLLGSSGFSGFVLTANDLAIFTSLLSVQHVSCSKLVALMKVFVQFFEYFKRKRFQENETVQSSSTSYWQLNPVAFLENRSSKNGTISFMLLQILTILRSRVRLEDLIDEEDRLLMEDLQNYIFDQFSQELSHSPLHAYLVAPVCMLFDDSFDRAVNFVKSSKFRNDEVIMRQFVRVIRANIEQVPWNKLSVFVQSLLKKYFKWRLCDKVKVEMLDLIFEAVRLGKLEWNILWDGLIDPTPSFVESHRDCIKDMLSAFSPEFIRVQFENGQIWKANLGSGETVAMLKLLVLSSKIINLNLAKCLEALLENFSQTRVIGVLKLASPTTELLKLVSKNDLERIVVRLICSWQSKRRSFESFPFKLFDLEQSHFFTHPEVFSRIIYSVGVEAVLRSFAPSSDMLTNCFADLVAFALFEYFSGRHEVTDLILNRLLKEHLKEGDFEVCFRDRTMDIMHRIVCISLEAGEPGLIDQAFDHIASMFKHESSKNIYLEAYMSHLLMIALNDLPAIPDFFSLVLSFLISRCENLLVNEALACKLLKTVCDAIDVHSRIPSKDLLDVVSLTLRYCCTDESAGILASILGKLAASQVIIAEWISRLTELDLHHEATVSLLRLIGGNYVACIGPELEQVIARFIFSHGNDAKLKVFVDKLSASQLIKGGVARSLLVKLKVLIKEGTSPLILTKILSEAALPVALAEYTSEETTSDDLTHDLISVLIPLLDDSTSAEFKTVLLALCHLLNTEGLVYWEKLPMQVKEKISFLKLPTIPKRLLLPKYRPKPNEQQYHLLWHDEPKGDAWLSALTVVVSTVFSKNPVWLKLGHLFEHPRLCRQILPIIFAEAYHSDQSNQTMLLAPMQRFIEGLDVRNAEENRDIVRLIYSLIGSLLQRKLACDRLDFDLKQLGLLMSKYEDLLTESIYIYELGLGSYESLSVENLKVLEELYSLAKQSDYSGSFSSSSKLNLINSSIDRLLNQKAKIERATQESIWELQVWDMERLPKEGLDRRAIDIRNILGSARSNDESVLLGTLEGLFKMRDCRDINEEMVHVMTSSVEYVQRQTVSFVTDLPDLSILSFSPDNRPSLFQGTARLLEEFRSVSDLEKLKRTFNFIEQIPEAPLELLMLNSCEKAKFLWDKDEKESAIELMKHSLCDTIRIDLGVGCVREYLASTFSLLAEWVYQVRLENSADIKEKYLDKALKILGSLPCNAGTLAEIYSTYAKFVDRMFCQMSRAENLEERGKILQRSRADLEALSKLGVSSRDEGVLRSLRELEMQHKADLQDYEEVQAAQMSYLILSVENYLRCLQLVSKFDFSVFRICSLWFEQFKKCPELSRLICESLGRVPCHKFIPLIYQLAARSELSEIRGAETGAFQDALERLLYRMTLKHPFHCLYQILALKEGAGVKLGGKRKLVYSTESHEVRRAAAASSLISKLKSKDNKVAGIVREVERLCEAYIELAAADIEPVPQPNVTIKFNSTWKISKLKALEIAVPTKALPIDPSGQYTGVSQVEGFAPGFKLAGGINLPKIIECIGSDGMTYRQLVKGKDDVRQDAVMEQVFGLVDQMLRSNEATRSKGLGIRTYRIIPLHALAGLLEWVSDTVPIGDWLLSAHARYHPEDHSPKVARNHMKTVWDDPVSTPAVKLRTFNAICARFRPVMRHFFWETARTPLDWWERRARYISSCAASSMLGHVVGLGDRHCQNILLDKKSGELVQIDLNMIFELGKNLRVPERVPFRMTRDMVDGMGPAGTKGGFTRAAEETLRLLRREAETIMMILEVFKYDPLYRWSLSPLKMARSHSHLEKKDPLSNTLDLFGEDLAAAAEEVDEIPPEATRSLLRVREKLLGFEEAGVQLSEVGQVRFLLQAATDVDALSQMYIGWQPWV